MNFGYNIAVFIASFFLKIIGLFHKKIKLFVNGRKETATKLSGIEEDDKVIWFHVASLGEFEQARPILEKVKDRYQNHQILFRQDLRKF